MVYFNDQLILIQLGLFKDTLINIIAFNNVGLYIKIQSGLYININVKIFKIDTVDW